MYVIAIDGPSGAGKSSVAKALAQEFGITYVDTGAQYRTIALYMVNHNIDTKDAQACIEALPNIHIDTLYQDGKQILLLNGEPADAYIRTFQIAMCASDISKIPEVRQFLLETQRSMAKTTSIIMDGRDIGTVVFPNADLKIYLTATPESRATRRYLEFKGFYSDTNYDKILQQIKERDEQDMNRAVAPLKQAEDAIFIDNSNMTEEETITYISNLIKERVLNR